MMSILYLTVALMLLSWSPLDVNALKYIQSSYLPIQLQCSCPFLNVIKAGGMSYMSPNGQWTPAEDAYPEIEAAADQECREQLPHVLGKCDIYVKGFDLQLHSGAKLAVSYECLANNSNVDFKKGFSERSDDVILQCPSIKHSIDIKEIQVEDGQAPISVLSVNEECDRQFSFQKMFNLVPLDCNVKRDDRQGCIMVSYECEELDQSGGAPVFPPPAGFGR